MLTDFLTWGLCTWLMFFHWTLPPATIMGFSSTHQNNHSKLISMFLLPASFEPTRTCPKPLHYLELPYPLGPKPSILSCFLSLSLSISLIYPCLTQLRPWSLAHFLFFSSFSSTSFFFLSSSFSSPTLFFLFLFFFLLLLWLPFLLSSKLCFLPCPWHHVLCQQSLVSTSGIQPPNLSSRQPPVLVVPSYTACCEL